MDIEELTDNFEILDDWEDKYRYIIDLGVRLPPLAPELHSEEWKVRGCQSQVWLVPEVKTEGGEKRIYFYGDSDAAIVKGIIAIVLTIYSGKSAKNIKETAVDEIFRRMGLEDHLSPSRRNGLLAMTEKIRHYADIL